MAVTELQVLRNTYAAAVRHKADPGEIEQARQALIYGRAERTIDVGGWLTLAPKLRVRLAVKLLAGDDSARATRQ